MASEWDKNSKLKKQCCWATDTAVSGGVPVELDGWASSNVYSQAITVPMTCSSLKNTRGINAAEGGEASSSLLVFENCRSVPWSRYIWHSPRGTLSAANRLNANEEGNGWGLSFHPVGEKENFAWFLVHYLKR